MPTSSVPIKNSALDIIGKKNVQIVPQSVTEQIYERNRELLQERRHTEELLYNVSEGVFAVDRSFTITLVNHALEEMLDIIESKVLGRKMDEVIKIQSEKGEIIDLKQYCFLPPEQEKVLSDVILKGCPKDYFVNVQFSVIKSATDPLDSECLMTISDITKEIILDKAKDEFISIASHELKSPMTVIKSYIWMLINNQVGDLTKEQLQYLEVTYKSTEHLIALINDMLNISRMGRGKLQFKCKEGRIISSISAAMAEYDIKAREKKIYLKRDFSKVSPDITAYYDEERFRECMVNLVSNAIKFTKEGGVVVSVEADNDFIKVVIQDTGVGVSKNDAKDLFKKFGKGHDSYQKAEVTGGTGLGLYIVKMYIEAMGGQIGYSSQGDFKGSTFWITIPKNQRIY